MKEEIRMKSSREKAVVNTSKLSIISNIILAGFKAFIGLLSNSIAITSDAVNNLSDALSSIITIIGTKLANKPADRDHPYGHGRIEYMTSMIVSAIVIYAGITALVESIKKMIHPNIVNYSLVTVIILSFGIIVKFTLGLYVKKKGKEVHSDSLVASGTDAFNDGILSTSVLLSILIYIFFKINIEAYIGIVLSLYIIKSGFNLIKESFNNILESRVESDLAKSIKREVLKEKEVQGAFDLILNNYGPDKYLGSVHIEVRDTLTVAEIDKISRKITKNVMKKYGVVLHTIGVYSVNTIDEKVIKTRKDIYDIVFSHKGILEMHGFYLDDEEKTISFDIIIDFNIKDREIVYKEIYDQVKEKYDGYKIIMTLDIDTSD